MSRLRFSLCVAVLAAHVIGSTASATVTIDWVRVGDRGNAADYTGYGAVAYNYQIGEFEVTNAQYTEFLNAVAATDANALYNTAMGSLGSPAYGSGITRSGSSGSYSYSTITGRQYMPVSYVSFWDATRFANWLHNGQPTGAQDNTTTEDGAYTLTPTGITNNTVTRNAGAQAFVASEDEWYKAAYYDTGALSYFSYPVGSNTQTSCTAPGATANTANCDFVNSDLTDVGSYTAATSPNGAFDQGGNVAEWNEATIYGSNRGLRGGLFFGAPGFLAASAWFSDDPTYESSGVGFRMASPAPASPVPSLNAIGMAMLWSLMGLGGWWGLRART